MTPEQVRKLTGAGMAGPNAATIDNGPGDTGAQPPHKGLRVLASDARGNDQR